MTKGYFKGPNKKGTGDEVSSKDLVTKTHMPPKFCVILSEESISPLLCSVPRDTKIAKLEFKDVRTTTTFTSANAQLESQGDHERLD